MVAINQAMLVLGLPLERGSAWQQQGSTLLLVFFLNGCQSMSLSGYVKVVAVGADNGNYYVVLFRNDGTD